MATRKNVGARARAEKKPRTKDVTKQWERALKKELDSLDALKRALEGKP